jgi:hypothetical protein
MEAKPVRLVLSFLVPLGGIWLSRSVEPSVGFTAVMAVALAPRKDFSNSRLLSDAFRMALAETRRQIAFRRRLTAFQP